MSYTNSNPNVTELNIGAILGEGNGRFVNISVTNTNVVVVNNQAAEVNIGGIVGDLEDYLVINNSVLSVNLTLNGKTQANAGGIVGTAIHDLTELLIFNCKVYVNITSEQVVFFGGVTSFMQYGWVEQVTLDFDLDLLAANNIVGGFVVDEPMNLTIRNCQNSISK